MTERISPRIDIAFKKIFGVEENKDLLISLINSIVSNDDQVADVTLLNPYNPKNFKQDKLSTDQKKLEQLINPEDPEAFERIDTLFQSGLNLCVAGCDIKILICI